MMNFAPLMEHLSLIEDPRINRTKKHKLLDILVITVCGFICGADNYTEIVEWARQHEEWLKQFLELSNGIPSHDTFGRVFALIDPREFEKAFQAWVEDFRERLKFAKTDKDFISVDGKKLCGTTNHKHPYTSAIGMVSAWSSEAGLILAQRKYDFKDEHEKHVMRDLIKLLDLEGCVVTLDANGACEDIFNAVADKKADFVVGLKKNMRNLYKIAEQIYEFNYTKQTKINCIVHEEKGHGRDEKRTYELIEPKHAEFWKPPSRLDAITKYPHVKSIGRVTRDIKRDGKQTHEVHYYMVSFGQEKIADFVHSVRSHWQIENKLHWVLDVALNEDRSTVRMKNAAQNVAVVRRLALNLLRQVQSGKMSNQVKRKKAAWDINFLLKILAGGEI